MKNKTLAKIVVATGAGVGVIATATITPWIILIPAMAAVGGYIGTQFSKGDDEEEEEKKGRK